MTEVMTATIPGCSVDDFLEMIVPRATRIKSKITREVFTRSAPFGLLRALGYRPDARAIPRIPIASNNKNNPSTFNPANSSARGHPSAHVITATTATPFFESSPEEFAQVLEESLGCKVTAPLFYEALLSDGCSFFRPSHADSGTMEVDISAWRAFVSSLQPHERASGFIRKQVFRMPLSGIPGVDVAEVEDFQYYALVQGCSGGSPMSAPSHDNENGQDKRGNFNGSQTLTLRRDKKRPSSTLCLNKETQPLSRDKKRPPSGLGQQKECKPRDTKARRLEFGMKLFIPALPEGSQFTIEVLVIVEPAEDDPSSNILRVLFASPPRHRRPAVTPQQVTLNSAAPHIRVGFRREEARACSSAAFISTADAHGQMLVPTNRQITAKFRKDGGTLSQAGDEELQYSPIELLSQRKQKDFPEAKTFSVMNGCRGTVYEAGNTNITTLKPGADFDVEWIIQAPHPGTMKLSIVKPSTDSSGKIMYKNYKTILTLDSFAQNGGTGSTTATMPTGVLVLNMQL
ncbi:hypothetical protein JM18_007559 [Phytophthora kernoviae]|uniref:Chitin-binding type-4 domain-containing protein n=1 Tax=Phytophthora kernoviae TaxID=325452 RepID=A0A921SEL5_9STRA|nr:hypothetical protein JM18_007559 [Phytophthora kernoviae]